MAMDIDLERDALIVVDLQHDFLPGGALAVAGGDEIVEPIAALARRFRTVIATQDFHPPGHVSFASSHPGRRPFESLQIEVGSFRPPHHSDPTFEQPVYWRQELWPDHCVAGSHGAELHPALPDEALTVILRKGTRREVDSYSAFGESPEPGPGPSGKRRSTGLGTLLYTRGIRRVFLCGLARDYCVRASALDAANDPLLVRAGGARFETVVLDDLTRAVAPDRQAAVDAEFDRAGVKRMTSRDLVFQTQRNDR
jgi:nicotinamidase/pyrazinamidase